MFYEFVFLIVCFYDYKCTCCFSFVGDGLNWWKTEVKEKDLSCQSYQMYY